MVEEAEEIKESATEFLEMYEKRSSWRCIQCLPIHGGRQAVRMAKMIIELAELGKELLANEFTYLFLVENVPHTDSVFQKFQSRSDAYGNLWDAVVTEVSLWFLASMEFQELEKLE